MNENQKHSLLEAELGGLSSQGNFGPARCDLILHHLPLSASLKSTPECYCAYEHRFLPHRDLFLQDVDHLKKLQDSSKARVIGLSALNCILGQMK